MCRMTASVLTGLILTVIGCSSGEVAVSGTVTLDGKPLEEGNIAFRPLPVLATLEATSGLVKGGKYQIKVRPGQNQVEITAIKPIPGPKDPFGMGPPPKSIIPEKYNTKSELREEVQAGVGNEFNFTLTSR